ncbi:MAG: chromate transporter [Termitinemataceae bacterium]|nr:MAG: chromate transporter [Termitinemataceae bacterium]
MKKIIEIFFKFVKIGCITFGGGYAILPILERELIKKNGWVTMEELTECYAIAQVTPGLIALNVSTFIGCKQRGAIGGIVATFGFILPGVTLIIIISLFLQQFKDIAIVQNAFAGIRLAVGALILCTIVKLVRAFIKIPAAEPRSRNTPHTEGAFVLPKSCNTARMKKENIWLKNMLSLLICIICFLLSFLFSTNPVFLICAAALIGVLFL